MLYWFAKIEKVWDIDKYAFQQVGGFFKIGLK
jgi:hypothetical protein